MAERCRVSNAGEGGLYLVSCVSLKKVASSPLVCLFLGFVSPRLTCVPSPSRLLEITREKPATNGYQCRVDPTQTTLPDRYIVPFWAKPKSAELVHSL